MKLNIKKVFAVIIVIALIIIGIWAGISLTQDEPNENIGQEVEQETATLDNTLDDNNNSVNNTITNTEIVNNTVNSNNTSIDITANNTVVSENTTTDHTPTIPNNEEKDSLNSYLEKFSLICYLDTRTKELEKDIKRNEDYIDIAMHIAKEHNALGEAVGGKEAASKETINSIISEIRGRTTADVLEAANVLYSYDSATEQYYSNHTDNRIAHVLEIQENTTENGVVNVKYTCCFPNETQLANNNFSGLGKYVITMELKENSSYNYSKYRIQNYEFVVE